MGLLKMHTSDPESDGKSPKILYFPAVAEIEKGQVLFRAKRGDTITPTRYSSRKAMLKAQEKLLRKGWKTVNLEKFVAEYCGMFQERESKGEGYKNWLIDNVSGSIFSTSAELADHLRAIYQKIPKKTRVKKEKSAVPETTASLPPSPSPAFSPPPSIIHARVAPISPSKPPFRFRHFGQTIKQGVYSILVYGLLVGGIFGVAVLIEYLNALYYVTVNGPLLSGIDPATLEWWHFFLGNSVNYYAFFLYLPAVWWTITLICDIIIAFIGSIVVIAIFTSK